MVRWAELSRKKCPSAGYDPLNRDKQGVKIDQVKVLDTPNVLPGVLDFRED